MCSMASKIALFISEAMPCVAFLICHVVMCTVQLAWQAWQAVEKGHISEALESGAV